MSAAFEGLNLVALDLSLKKLSHESIARLEKSHSEKETSKSNDQVAASNSNPSKYDKNKNKKK